jgi:hypothetical protein
MMTDQLAQLRDEIEAEIARRRTAMENEEQRIAALGSVLARIARIEFECPSPAVTEAGRAPRRNIQAAVLAIVGDWAQGINGEGILNELERRVGPVAGSAINRVLRALVDGGKLVNADGGYRLPGLALDQAAE